MSAYGPSADQATFAKYRRTHTNRLADECTPWLRVEWLPSYAPNLNPVEAMWSYAKYTAPANFVPDDREHLEDAGIEAVGYLHFKPQLLQSFIQAAKLRL